MPLYCTPTLTRRAISTYTFLGFAGYSIASILSSALAIAWEFTLTERLVGLFTPPLAFLVVVTVASSVAGRERIVFYQAAFGGVLATAIVAAIADVHVARLVDLAALGIGVFLVFGRVGCFAVACCHGTLGHGVVYGPEHVQIGFWARWEGRSLWPVQLIESVSSGVLVGVALVAGTSSPGTAAIVYIVGYGAVRFVLELVRGDSARPYWRGISEAQWFALLSVMACAVWRPGPFTIGTAMALVAGSIVLAARARYRELLLPPHLRELDDVCQAVQDDHEHSRRETSRGVALTCHALPDGRIDWILSSSHPAWSLASARQIAFALWREHEVVAGRTPGVVHILVPSEGPQELARNRKG